MVLSEIDSQQLYFDIATQLLFLARASSRGGPCRVRVLRLRHPTSPVVVPADTSPQQLYFDTANQPALGYSSSLGPLRGGHYRVRLAADVLRHRHPANPGTLLLSLDENVRGEDMSLDKHSLGDGAAPSRTVPALRPLLVGRQAP